MQHKVLLALGFALLVMGCAEKEQAPPEAAMPDDAATAETPAPLDMDFLEHMHKHAEQIDALNFALEDGDLEAARTPAYWLSSHDTVDGLDSELREFVYGMRMAAEAVEAAADLETARAASARISEQCQGCHKATGADGA